MQWSERVTDHRTTAAATTRPRFEASEVSASSSIVWLSMVPLLNTATTIACRADRPTICTERTVADSARRPDDDGGVLCDLSEQVGGLVQQLLEATVGRDRRTCRHAAWPQMSSRPGVVDVVDEEPVSLVGRHSTGRRVRLRQVPLLLEHRHLVADGGGADPHPGQIGDMRRPDRLRRGDVLLHDGSEDGGLAFVEHLALQVSEC